MGGWNAKRAPPPILDKEGIPQDLSSEGTDAFSSERNFTIVLLMSSTFSP